MMVVLNILIEVLLAILIRIKLKQRLLHLIGTS